MNGPLHLKFGGGISESSIHPIVLVLLLVAIALMLVLPRKYVVVPFLLAIFLTPYGQQIYVVGAHFFVPRILIFFGLIRVGRIKLSSRTEIMAGGFNSVDKAFMPWAILSSSAMIFQFWQTQALINQCGFLFDAIGGYVLLRFLIRDEEDILCVIETFAVIVAVLAVTMSLERLFDRNLFGYLGGRMIPFRRDGAIRSQGTLMGPIPAGTFAATLLCLFVLLWESGKSKLLGLVGVVGACVMVVTSASSTPLLASLASILGLSMWPLRKSMRTIRWGIVISLVSLHLVMKAPVWFLINHVDLIAGNSGYHRAELIDQCVRHFSDWWLMGVKSTAEWGWDMWDQANQFTAVANGSGLVPLICFILMISRSFGRIGRARKLVDGDTKKEWLLYLLGAALFSHVVAFFGISYNDQANNAWYVLLVLITAATAPILAKSPVLEHRSDLKPAGSGWAYRSPAVPGPARMRLPH